MALYGLAGSTWALLAHRALLWCWFGSPVQFFRKAAGVRHRPEESTLRGPMQGPWPILPTRSSSTRNPQDLPKIFRIYPNTCRVYSTPSECTSHVQNSPRHLHPLPYTFRVHATPSARTLQLESAPDTFSIVCFPSKCIHLFDDVPTPPSELTQCCRIYPNTSRFYPSPSGRPPWECIL